MSPPGRLLRNWWTALRMRDQVRDVEWQLGIALHRSVRLVPARPGGGYDCIYFARALKAPARWIASVRVNCPWRSETPDEPHLPRRVLCGQERIIREASAYRRLSEHGLTPGLLVQGSNFLANEWLPGARLAEVLRRDSTALWRLLPEALRAVAAMHELGVVHMDLNCGNLMLLPDTGRVCLIDFEYAPRPGFSLWQQRSFDVLRLIDNLLRPRRGLDAVVSNLDRFCDIVIPWLPEGCGALLDQCGVTWFRRIHQYAAIRDRLLDAAGAPAGFSGDAA